MEAVQGQIGAEAAKTAPFSFWGDVARHSESRGYPHHAERFWQVSHMAGNNPTGAVSSAGTRLFSQQFTPTHRCSSAPRAVQQDSMVWDPPRMVSVCLYLPSSGQTCATYMTRASSEQVQSISFCLLVFSPVVRIGFSLRSNHQKETCPSHC